jgi:hypothetical protein
VEHPAVADAPVDRHPDDRLSYRLFGFMGFSRF